MHTDTTNLCTYTPDECMNNSCLPIVCEIHIDNARVINVQSTGDIHERDMYRQVVYTIIHTFHFNKYSCLFA